MNFILDNDRMYWFVMAVLVVGIVVTGVKTSKQTYARHQLYFELSNAKKTMQTLKIEEQRLLIEQQTFSATPHIAQRSVSELGMFYPTDKERMVIVP